MFTLSVLAVLLGPLIGIGLMEAGMYGPDVYQFGYRNGAAFGFAVHAAVVFVCYLGVYWLCRSSTSVGPRQLRYPPAVFRRLAAAVFLVLAVQTLFMVVALGAAQVLTGDVGKGEFRAQQGVAVGLAYLGRNFVVPTVTALLAFVYRKIHPEGLDRVLMLSALLGCGFTGALWGFKTAAVMAVLPALIVLYPVVKVRTALAAIAGAYGSLVMLSVAFDKYSVSEAAIWILVRGTVGAGNVAWKIWDLEAYGEAFPPYWPTLGMALGGRLASVLGIWSRSDATLLYRHDFTAMTTEIASDFGGTNVVASNVTATSFAEGVIAFGAPGYLLMSVIAGVVLGLLRSRLHHSIDNVQPVAAAIIATYFVVSVWVWLNAGGITVLFMIPYLVAYGVTASFAALLLWSAGGTGTGGGRRIVATGESTEANG